MGIDPTVITTQNVGSLPTAAINLANIIPHEVGGNLKQATINDLAVFITAYVGAASSLVFNTTKVTTGQTLPATTSKEFLFVGAGTFTNVGGGAAITTTSGLNVLTSNGSFWTLTIEVPVTVTFNGLVQTIRQGFTGTATSEGALFDALELIKADVIKSAPFLGSIIPTATPTGTGIAYWLATQSGTYTNFGGVVVNANSFAVISRSAAGTFSISQTALDLSTYALKVDSNKINAWTAKAYVIGDQVNYLGKDWVANATTVAGDVPNTSTKWVERLNAYNDIGQTMLSVFPSEINALNSSTDFVGLINANGAYISDNNYRTTDFKAVTDGSTISYSMYVTGGMLAVSYYDSYKTYVTTGKVSFTTIGVELRKGSIKVPSGVSFVRFCYSNLTTPSSVFYYEPIKPNVLKNTSDISVLQNTTSISKECLSATDVVGYINTTGSFIVYSGYKSTDFIPTIQYDRVDYSAYITGGISVVSYWDANKVFINAALTFTGEPAGLRTGSLVVPSNVSFVRFSYSTTSSPSSIKLSTSIKGTVIKNESDLSLLKASSTSKLDYVNYSLDVVGYTTPTGGFVSGDNNYRTTDFKSIAAGTVINYDANVTGGISFISYWDINKVFISSVSFTTSGVEKRLGNVTVPEGVIYTKFCYRRLAATTNALLESSIYKTIVLSDVSESALLVNDLYGGIYEFLTPSKIYTTCNDVIPESKGRNRNYSASIYLDHILKTVSSEKNLRFDNGTTQMNFSAPMDVTDSNEFNPVVSFNKGVNINSQTHNVSIRSGLKEKKSFSITNISTLNSVTKTAHPKVLCIGDSITYAEQATLEDDGFSKNHGYHFACKELFLKDKIDNASLDYDITFLGYQVKTKTITYNGTEYPLRVCHDGRRGITLAQHLNGSVGDFWNGSAWSLSTYINKYRTMDDNGVRLTLGNGTGSLINASNINNIDVCTPTHVVVMLGANDQGNVTLANYQTIVNTIKLEFPNCVVGLATSEFGGTFFPSQYPMIPKEMHFWNHQQAITGHLNQYKVQNFLQGYYDNATQESNGVFLIPFFYSLPPYSYAYRTGSNVSQKFNQASENKVMIPYGWGYHVHINGIGHSEWGYQLYSWLKYTIAKTL